MKKYTRVTQRELKLLEVIIVTDDPGHSRLSADPFLPGAPACRGRLRHAEDPGSSPRQEVGPASPQGASRELGNRGPVGFVVTPGGPFPPWACQL